MRGGVRGGAHCGKFVVLLLGANTGAENEMLKIDCVSCASATGLLQSKRNNECDVHTLGLAVPSTLDVSVKVEHILTFLQKRKNWMEILKYLSLFLLHDRNRVALFSLKNRNSKKLL